MFIDAPPRPRGEVVPISSSTTSKFDPNNWQPELLGPTWQTDEAGEFILPEYSLGWEIADWAYENLTNEDGENWLFTNEQMRLLLWFYEVDPDTERFVYRDGICQRLKGWG